MSYNFLASKNRLDRQVRYFFRLYCYRNCFHDWTLNCLFSQNNILYVINKHQNVNRKKNSIKLFTFCLFAFLSLQSLWASKCSGFKFEWIEFHRNHKNSMCVCSCGWMCAKATTKIDIPSNNDDLLQCFHFIICLFNAYYGASEWFRAHSHKIPRSIPSTFIFVVRI